MKTKICTKCGKEKSIEDFHWRNKEKGTRRSECKECHNNHMKKDYIKKKDFVNVAKECGCQKCGYNKCLDALEFHHINPAEKDYAIAQMTHDHRTQEQIENELKKCIVLCANCHREFHYLERTENISLDTYLSRLS